MMSIKIIQVGKTREDWIQRGEAEFLKRLKRFARVEISVITELGKGDRQKIKKEEGERILARTKPCEFVCLLTVRGQELTSLQFANLLKKWQAEHGGHVTFVVGGSWGVSESVTQRANIYLSLSKMTMLHEMARLFLLEQIYRGFTILQGSEYHKAD